MDALTTVLPYCGAPPDPGEIWSRWRLDPVVLAALAAVWLCYAAGCRRARRGSDPGARQQALFHAGWLVATLALVSPLCPLSVSLFAARASQHVLLTLIAAPLVAAAAPLRAFGALLGLRFASRLAAAAAGQPMPAAATFAVVVWVWHMPGPYAATFASTFVYWTMHVTMFCSALWLWSCLLAPSARGFAGALFAGIASAIQMGLLGALITLSPRPFYVPHFLTAEAWGFSPLQDQQLGGAIMWVVGCTVFFAVAMAGLAGALREPRLASTRQPAVLRARGDAAARRGRA